MGAVLALNTGSSSVKFAVYEGTAQVLHGEVDRIPRAPILVAVDALGAAVEGPELSRDPPADAGAAALRLLPWLVEATGHAVTAVGHRVVHGGTRRSAPERATPALLAELDALAPLAPLHQPHNLAAVRALLESRPALPQALCFDTAFHRTQDPLVERFALPAALHEAGIRRYGFHGLSYESIAAALPGVAGAVLASGRVVAAHLGNGASLCAMRGGRSVATSMGFTALDGLMMGTRGLLGVSGISSDVRDLLASGRAEARLALDLYAHCIRRGVAEMAAVLEGLDALVFTGGVGRHQAPVRAAVCERLAWLGLRLDTEANARHGPLISAAGSRVAAFVLPDDENAVIAAAARALLGGAG
jgi:acetate kinase